MINPSLIPRHKFDEYHGSYEITAEKRHQVDIQNRFALYALHQVFEKQLEASPGRKMLELGCAPGAWLHYFSCYFKYNAFGIEISHAGCQRTVQNLQYLQAIARIVCGDIASIPLKPGSFDLVFSSGLIEHFENPAGILQLHFDLINDNGTVCVIVPNYSYLNKLYVTAVLRATTFLKSHNLRICNLANFRKAVPKSVFTKYLGYCGTFYPDIYNVNLPQAFEPQLQLWNRKVTAFLKKMPRFECCLFSPLILFIGKKRRP
jgi:SAM-dependent methyltransferase